MALTKREIRRLLMLEHLYEGGGNVTPPPVIPVSSAVLKSTGDVNNPAVGDILYLDVNYVSATTESQDYVNTITDFKRDGVSIALIEDATQYFITQNDIGTLITCELTIHEQDGNVQSVISLTTGANVTGSAVWTLGELQDTFRAVYDLSANEYPRIQQHSTDTPTDTYKFKSISGNSIDMKAPQAGALMAYDTVNNLISGAGAAKLNFMQPISGWDGSNVSMFFKFTAPAQDIWLYRYMGATNRYLSYDNGAGRNRLEINGIRTANEIVQTGDEVIVMLRFSDTSFTTYEGIAGQKTEFYIRVDNGSTIVEHFYDNANNFMLGADFSYGFGTTDTVVQTGIGEVKALGFSDSFMNDTDFSNLLNYLIAL